MNFFRRRTASAESRVWYAYRLLGLVLSLQLVFPGPLLAHGVHSARSAPNQNNQGLSSAASTVRSLDLSSSIRSVTAGSNLVQPTSIREGGTRRTVTASDLLTPGEFVAVQEVLSTGHQTIILASSGRAMCGSVQLTSSLVQQASDLVIPKGMTVFDDFAQTGNLNLQGSFSNAGKFYAISSSPQVTSAAISAVNIFNQKGALISSVLPSSSPGGLSTLVNSLSLSLNAANNISNAGTITSAGNLTLKAGTSIINALPAGVTGPSPVMQAASNVNLQAASIVNGGLVSSQLGAINAYTSRLVNSGMIQAPSGSIQIANLSGLTLGVDNTLGLIAAQDTVLFDTLGSTSQSKATLSVVGGTLSANNVAFESPDGRINVSVDRINGSVDASGGTAEIGTKEGNLDLADVHLTGDPIFFAQGGSLDLSGLFTSNSTFSTTGGDFVALASGNITAATAPANATVDATSGSGQGGLIVLAAGVNFTVDASQAGCSQCSGFYTVGGTSTAGGSINLPTVKLLTNNGISLTAHSPGGAGKPDGSINIDSIRTMGFGNAAVTADGTVTASAIDASAVGSGDGGSISINAPTLAAPSAGLLSVSANGASMGNGGGISINARTLSTPGTGSLSVSASGSGTGNGGTISLNIAQTSAAPGASPISVSASGGDGGNGGSVFLNATGESVIAIGLQAGNLSITATGGSSGSASGSGGIFRLLTFGNLTLDPASVNVAPLGANGNGGEVNLAVLRTGNTEHILNIVNGGVINANGAGNGRGGFIVFDGGTFKVTAPGPVTLAVNGGGTGNGGVISIRSTVTEALGSNNLAIGSGPGNLIISATGGSPGSASGNGGSVRLLNNGGNLTLDPASLNVAPLGSNGNGGFVFLDISPQGAAPGGNLNLVEQGIINTSAVGNGNGGIISVNASTLQVTAPGPVTMAANGAGAGNGGRISMFFFNVNQLVVGSGAGNLILSATGGSFSGNGGSVQLNIQTTGSSLTIDPAFLNVAPLGTNGNGGSIDFSLPYFPGLPVAGLILLNGGGFNASGVGSGNGGSISLRAQTVQVTATGPASLTANGGDTGNGGSISITAATLQVAAAGPVTLSANGNNGFLTINANASANSDLNFSAGSSVSLAPSTNVQTSGNVAITTAVLQLGAGSLVSTSGASSTINVTSLDGSVLTIQAPPGGSATIQTAGGGINIGSSGQALTFLNSSTDATTLYLNGGPLTLSGWNVTLSSLVTLNSNNTITIKATNEYTQNQGAALNGTGSLSQIVIQTPTVLFGDNTSIFSAMPTNSTNGAIGIFLFDGLTAGTANSLTINLQGTTALNTAGSNVRIWTAVSNGLGTTLPAPQLLTIQSVDNSQNTSSTPTNLFSNTFLFMVAFNGTFRNNSTNITDSAPSSLGGLNKMFTIVIQGGSGRIGSGGITLDSSPGFTPGLISATGTGMERGDPNFDKGILNPGGPLILIRSYQGNTTLSTNYINFNSSYTFSTGPTGDVEISNDSNSGHSGSVNLAAGTTLTATGGGTLRLVTASLNLGDNSKVVSTTASGAAIAVFSANDDAPLSASYPLTITLLGSTATISTAGGSINIMPTAFTNPNPPPSSWQLALAPDQPVTFAKSAGSGTATLNLNGGPVFITTSGINAITSINAGVALVAAEDLSVTSGTTLNVNGPISANHLTLTVQSPVCNVCNIVVNANLTGLSSVTLVNGASSIIQSAGVIATPSLTLLSNNTISVINASAGYVSVNTSGDVSVTDFASVTLGSSRGNDFALTSSGDITVSGALTANRLTLTSTANNGAINLNANTTGHFTAELTTHGPTSSVSVAPGVTLLSDAITGFGGPLITVTAASFTNSGTVVAIPEAGDLPVIGFVHVRGTDSGLTVSNNGIVKAISISLSDSSNIVVTGAGALIGADRASFDNAGMVIFSPGSVSFASSTGSVNITQGSVTGILSGNAATGFNATVATGGLQAGSISTSNGSIVLTVPNGALGVVDGATITATGGDVTLLNYSPASTISIGSMATLAANQGSITLQNIGSPSTISIGSGATLVATEGNITLQNNVVAGSISIASGATLTASSAVSDFLGNVYIVMGPVPTTPVKGKAPDNLATNLSHGGKTFFGSNSITALCCNNIANVDGGRVIFNTNSLPASAITLAGNVTINSTNPRGTEELSSPSGAGSVFPGLGLDVALPTGATASGRGIASPGLNGGMNPSLGGAIPGASGVPLGPRLPTQGQGAPAGKAGDPAEQVGASPGQSETSSLQTENVSKTNEQDSDNSDLIPISFVQPIARLGTPQTSIVTYEHEVASVRHSGQARLTFRQSGLVNLRDGEILVASSRPTTVEAGNCTVAFAPGTIALVSRNGETVAVRTLHDSRGNSTTMYSGGQQLARISAGQEVVLAPDASALSATVSQAPLGRRRMALQQTIGGKLLGHCDVPSLAVIDNSQVLNSVIHSTRRSDRAIAERLLKTAACLQMVTAKYGAYAAVPH